MSADNLAYSATLTPEGSSSFTIKNDGKGNSEMTSSADGYDFDMIILNGVYYLKSGDGWTKSDGGFDTVNDPSESLTYNFTQDHKDDYKKIGKEACGNLSCFKYQFVDRSNPTDETFIWFDTKDYRLQKLTYKTVDNVASGNSEMTFSYGSVKISEPSPIQ
jgi:hypothetical protein